MLFGGVTRAQRPVLCLAPGVGVALEAPDARFHAPDSRGYKSTPSTGAQVLLPPHSHLPPTFHVPPACVPDLVNIPTLKGCPNACIFSTELHASGIIKHLAFLIWPIQATCPNEISLYLRSSIFKALPRVLQHSLELVYLCKDS